MNYRNYDLCLRNETVFSLTLTKASKQIEMETRGQDLYKGASFFKNF